MASAKQDFERFLTWLHLPQTNAGADVRRLGNLVLANFDALAETSKQRSQRSVYLVGVARKNWAATPDAMPDVQASAAGGEWPWKRLLNMTLGPFRGFRTPERFDLQKRVILFYGPNGSGKTSFCEGLEYALLGGVEEADSKRIEPRSYLANVHERRFAPPTLSATDSLGREVAVVANADTYRFCFIEKNRIDSFSRMAAKPTAQRAELIATLFGMDKFSDFVGHFNESIDNQIVISAAKKLTLSGRREALATDQAKVDGEQAALALLLEAEAKLAATHSEGMTYGGLKVLLGTVEAPGRLQELEGILNAVPPAQVGMTAQGLLDHLEKAREHAAKLAETNAQLEKQGDQVSFKELYEAVLAVQGSSSEHCPACDTPLTGSRAATANPYEKAAAGLAQLKALGELQERRKSEGIQVASASRALRSQMTILANFLVARDKIESQAGKYLAALSADPAGLWWSDIYPAPEPSPEGDGQPSMLDELLRVAKLAEEQDKASALASEARDRNIRERDSLNAFQLSVQEQDLKRKQLVDDAAAARARITAFDTANAALIAEVAQEALDIERDAPIKAAYDRFLILIRQYREELPATLMAGLNEAAMSLYNEFNGGDLEVDKLAALHLPLTGEEKIEISFRRHPVTRIDALRVLSEGHIRCLGLAILLAKSQSAGAPVIVFDDVINAIDHDHRAGIRETIFESDHFADTQLLVTCHSNEFIKDIQQHLPANRRDECAVYLFRGHVGDYQPRVRSNVPTRNYIEKARASMDALDSRAALASSRQALEMLSEKTWAWLGSHNVGLLNLQIAGMGAEPGLRNLCDGLFKRCNETNTFAHANKQPLAAAFGRILGIPAENLVWSYLNKGTHEEANREDFDASLVEQVIQTLEEIDALDLRRGR